MTIAEPVDRAHSRAFAASWTVAPGALEDRMLRPPAATGPVGYEIGSRPPAGSLDVRRGAPVDVDGSDSGEAG